MDTATDGTTIKLMAGNYGTLYIRQNENSEIVWTGHGGGKLDSYTNGCKRVLKNVTITGEKGVNVDRIIVEGGKFSSSNMHSNSATNPVLDSYIELVNFTIENINFNVNNFAAIHVLNNGQTNIKGMTIRNCTVVGSGDASNTAERVLFGGVNPITYKDLNGVEIMTTEWSDIKLANCKVSDMHQVIELRNITNLDIVNNNFQNIRQRDILLAGTGADSGAIKGEINITGNTSDGSTERFLRASVVLGNITVSDNTITNWAGTDGDFIKISNATGTIRGTNNTYDGAVVELTDGVCLKPAV